MHWLAEIFRCVCAWCPVCGWEAFTHEAAPGFCCPDCGAAALPPRCITEPMRPFLLENNPVLCACCGVAVVAEFDAASGLWVCACDLCETEGYGDTSAEAEMAFHDEGHRPATVLDQAIDRGCMQGFRGNVVVCAVEGAARDYDLPLFLRDQTRLGCILVDTSTEEDWMAHRNREYCSLVLFHPRWWPEAWSITRRIRHSGRGLAALVQSADLGGIYISLSRNHSLVLDGRQIFGGGGHF